VGEHKKNQAEGYKNRVHRRVCFEQHEDMTDHPRKQVRKWKRACQLRLIEERNPGWIPACAGMTFWNKDLTRILHE